MVDYSSLLAVPGGDDLSRGDHHLAKMYACFQHGAGMDDRLGHARARGDPGARPDRNKGADL
jgi:hypothetical protein